MLYLDLVRGTRNNLHLGTCNTQQSILIATPTTRNPNFVCSPRHGLLPADYQPSLVRLTCINPYQLLPPSSETPIFVCSPRHGLLPADHQPTLVYDTDNNPYSIHAMVRGTRNNPYQYSLSPLPPKTLTHQLFYRLTLTDKV